MSMNLKCNKVSLWQTPTAMTYELMKAGPPRNVLLKYIEWLVKGQLAFNDHLQDEDPVDAEALQWWSILEHCSEVAQVVARNDADLVVWVE